MLVCPTRRSRLPPDRGTAKIIGLGGHYVLAVKGNAPAAYAVLDALPWSLVDNARGGPR